MEQKTQEQTPNDLKRKIEDECVQEAAETNTDANGEPNVKVAKNDDHINASAEEGSKESDQKPDLDPLAYTKTGFTSEIFKIQIHNLPKFGFGELKKRLSSLGLKPHKLKSPRPEVTYVCFRCEEDRQFAITKLNGHTWKGKTLSAKEAAPLADPFLEKLKNSKEGTLTCVETFTPEQSLKKLKDNVMPLWEMDYEKQLEFKNKNMSGVLKKLAQHYSVKDEFRKRPGWRYNSLACDFLPIIPSPKLTEYRNKNEFTIGYSQDGKTVKVGFRYGLYKSGTTCIGDIEGINIIKPAALKVTQSFEQFLSQSEWSPYLQQTESGHWYQLTVRTFESGDVMVMVDFTPRSLEKTDLERALESVRQYYTQGPGQELTIKSFYFRVNGKPPNGFPKLQLIYGDPYVYETLLGLKFRISPDAFFQVNTAATEQLYKLVAEWSEANPSSTVLDVCCGTGTIGLSMAKSVKQVIGIEMCEPAVNDAKINAQINGVNNVRYVCGKVEDVMHTVLNSVKSTPQPTTTEVLTPTTPSSSGHNDAEAVEDNKTDEDTRTPTNTAATTETDVTTTSSDTSITTTAIQETEPTAAVAATAQSSSTNLIAILDPPRAGVHKTVIKSLRACEEIQRLVYVSCSAINAMENFVDLIRPQSSKLRGKAFTLEKAVAIDLFPSTKHAEMLLLFTR